MSLEPWYKRASNKEIEARSELERPYREHQNDPKYQNLGQGARASAMRADGFTLPLLDECYADAHEAGLVAGRHFTDWYDELTSARKSGELEGALKLALRLIEATERAQDAEAASAEIFADQLGGLPEQYPARETPPGYSQQAAMIYHKQGDYESEVAIIDRWEARAGDPSHWRGSTHARLIERRDKAKAALAKRAAK